MRRLCILVLKTCNTESIGVKRVISRDIEGRMGF